MAYGGGTWLSQNKVLPGTYVNFVSAAAAYVNISDRGYIAMGIETDWGISDEIFTVENGDFQKASSKYFGYDYTDDKMKGLRDLFIGAKTAYLYRLNSGGNKATLGNFEAKYEGIFGNKIGVAIENDIDAAENFIVTTYVDSVKKDEQHIKNYSEFIENNYLKVKNKTLEIEAFSKDTLIGGTNGIVTGLSHQIFLDKSEKYRFNSLGYVGDDEVTKKLYVAHTKRMRDEVGVKFQTVVYNYEADYEGIINVVNKVEEENKASLVYFVTGVSGSCAINKSLTNMNYTGDFTVVVDHTQTQLKEGMKKGHFLFHQTGDNIAILSDVNSFVSWSIYKNEDFYRNQVVRIIDQVAMDIASLFNKRYLGKGGNNEARRNALWADIVAHHQGLERIEALQNFNPKELLVREGADKVSVLLDDFVTPVTCMEKLYMTVQVI